MHAIFKLNSLIFRTGLLDQVLAIQTMEYLYNETEYLPWSDADTHMAYINVIFYRSPRYAIFRVKLYINFIFGTKFLKYYLD